MKEKEGKLLGRGWPSNPILSPPPRGAAQRFANPLSAMLPWHGTPLTPDLGAWAGRPTSTEKRYPPPKPFLPMAADKGIMTMGISSHHLRVIYITFGAVSMGPIHPKSQVEMDITAESLTGCGSGV